MRRCAAMLVLLLAACGSGGSLPARADAILENADHVELLALGDRAPEGATESFDDRVILGRAVASRSEGRTIALAIREAAEDADVVMRCFEPHHGVRVRSGAQPLELSICYACSQMHVFGSNPYVPIDPAALRGVLDPPIEAQANLRFHPRRGPFGQWDQIARRAR